MSFYDEDDDDSNQGGNQNPLRKVVKDLEKKLAAAEKTAQEADERASKAEKANAQRTVADVLKDKGADPRLARYVLRDLEGDDLNTEAVDKWLTTEGELFGYKPQIPEGDPAATLGLPAGTQLPPDLIEAYKRFQSGQQGGAAVTGGDQIAAKLADPNLTQADLLNLISTAT